jgi:uncharacterized protein
MIAIDTNVLIYAHRAEFEWHANAQELVNGLAEGAEPWAIPWPCVHEFYATVTHATRLKPPSPRALALEQLSAWLGSPSLVMIGETPSHLAVLADLLEAGKVIGPQVHDARIAAICLQHGVKELWTADRDFSRFPQVRLRNPLI